MEHLFWRRSVGFYTYYSSELLTQVKVGDSAVNYDYDAAKRLASITSPSGTAYGFVYDDFGSNTDITIGSRSLSSYEYDNAKGLLDYIQYGNGTLIDYSYDELGRQTETIINQTLRYRKDYDGYSRLLQIEDILRNQKIKYEYDIIGRLVSERVIDSLTNQIDAQFDIRYGEIVKTYTYGDSEWKDLLTAYNGESVTYDGIGNPLTYRDGMTFTWTDGRKLSSIIKGTDSISYTYDANGLRTSKTVNETTTEYYWLNGMLQGQKTGDEYILFLYDENGVAYGFIVQNGTEKSYYYYEFNLQSDIIGIIDSTGSRVVEYTYNEWGKLLSITGTLADTIGQKNPLRYRGYYYDAETGFYYVSSRYYDPEIGRWLNADNAIAGVGGNLNGYNLYSYCFNNPVNMSDPTGNWTFNAIGKLIAKTVCTIIVATVVNHIVNAINKKKIDKEVKESYDKETAKEEIDEILEQYGDDVNATFNDEGVEIENSIKVNSRYDRQKISTIITRTESVTSREYDDLSAEWLFHNIAYDLHIKRESAISANLDYVSDSRWYVVGATDLLEIFGWE